MAQSKRGRPKGSRNRITNEAKAAIQMAFDKLGGVERLVAWAEGEQGERIRLLHQDLPQAAAAAGAGRAVPEPLAPVRGR